MAAMEDDFQFVDFNTGHKMSNDEDDEHYSESDSDNGEIVTVSDLTSLKKDVSKSLSELKLQQKKNMEEYSSLQSMKQEMQGKLSTLDSLIKKHSDCIKNLKDESNQYNKLNETVKKELSNLEELRKVTDIERNELKADRDKLNRQIDHFKKDCNELDDILSKLSIVPEYVNRNKDINSKLNSFYTETREMEKEIRRLQELREQQKLLIKQAKLDLESMKSDHIGNCLREFDKSVAYSCKDCGTHIAIENDVESRCYQVGQGTFTEKKRGYLFKSAANLELGATKTENFTTGSYKIAWVSCVKCQQSMGWKYLSADNPNNTAKVNKYCLARYSLHSPQERNEQNTTSTT